MNKKVVFHKTFLKHFDKRVRPDKKLHKQFLSRFSLFKSDRKNTKLKDHPLKGARGKERAFSITGNYRVVYEEYDSYFLFLDVGTHNQVYK